MSISIKIVTWPLSTMGEHACTQEGMVSYHYPSRIQGKTGGHTTQLCPQNPQR